MILNNMKSMTEIAKANVYYLDYFNTLNDGENAMAKTHMGDGLNFTGEGYEVIEPLLEKLIKKI
tara:strand:- start:731 stop:922 length:192 start_codon:yes stop_codon:yes gene_type:complete